MAQCLVLQFDQPLPQLVMIMHLVGDPWVPRPVSSIISVVTPGNWILPWRTNDEGEMLCVLFRKPPSGPLQSPVNHRVVSALASKPDAWSICRPEPRFVPRFKMVIDVLDGVAFDDLLVFC
jgi:hypothetical protein